MSTTPSLQALRAALPDELARALVPASELRERSPRRELLPTAVPPLDRLLHGGLPRGALIEVVAPRSSGRFSLGLAVLAAATRAGEAAALVDMGDHLDPQAAAAEGVDLRRLLWVRPSCSDAGGCFGAPHTPRPPRSPLMQALAATETLLATGFALVVLDLGLRVPRGARQPAAWLRLSRGALVQDAALLVLSPARLTGGAAQAVLSTQALCPAWRGALPGGPLLQGLTLHLTLEKRGGERPSFSDAWRLWTRESTVVSPPMTSSVRPSTFLPAPHAYPARRVAHG